jgi:hypothetical protein
MGLYVLVEQLLGDTTPLSNGYVAHKESDMRRWQGFKARSAGCGSMIGVVRVWPFILDLEIRKTQQEEQLKGAWQDRSSQSWYTIACLVVNMR